MADTFLPILKAITAKLRANTSVMGYVATRIYSNVPQNTTFPYIRLTIDSSPFDTVSTTGMEHSINVQIFSRDASPNEAGAIRAAVYNLLHRNESAFTLDNGTLFNINLDGLGFLEQEPDGKTWQAMAQFRAVVMD